MDCYLIGGACLIATSKCPIIDVCCILIKTYKQCTVIVYSIWITHWAFRCLPFPPVNRGHKILWTTIRAAAKGRPTLAVGADTQKGIQLRWNTEPSSTCVAIWLSFNSLWCQKSCNHSAQIIDARGPWRPKKTPRCEWWERERVSLFFLADCKPFQLCLDGKCTTLKLWQFWRTLKFRKKTYYQPGCGFSNSTRQFVARFRFKVPRGFLIFHENWMSSWTFNDSTGLTWPVQTLVLSKIHTPRHRKTTAWKVHGCEQQPSWRFQTCEVLE